MLNVIDTVVQGILLGGLYALFATGLSLAFGIMRFVNIAHGDFIVLGAFAALALIGVVPMHPLLTLAIVVPALAILGYWAQRLIYNRTLGRDIMPPLLVTFGLSVMLQNGLLELFSGDSRRLDAGMLSSASIGIGELSVGVFPVLTLVIAVAVIAGLQFLFSHTAIGRSLRATSDDPEIVQLMAVDSRRIYAVAMGIASATVALAGVILGMTKAFDPLLGPPQLLFAFEAVIIGGLGSLWGTLAGGMLLGVAQAVGFRLDPGWGILFGHLAFFAVLLVRPQGLFPKTRDH
ncbi:branched-chain amino acid ABC transporter permease [Thauera sinica]|uniref:Branched-chain amino acid ABC transporter permease n=1 Tax=Thauera sinica TaxID=2665146 RepID=A0ABW1AML3_9RHOO|nr:branched-chain amino acid ABC transporter permease [Thauera sp. K11]ATE61652.1 branched-chain amino acid ABC transporter permease [Thauera sp. K11]